MSNAAYQHALRLGQRELRYAQSRGGDPHPAALETILPGLSGMNEIPLGTVSVQLDMIAGTMTETRRECFSRSFYPLLDDSSEFAAKWSALAGHHLNEGIQDPIRAIEYLGLFYIVEGHKRVSVLRYFGAPTVQADVTRVMPRRTDDPEIQVYFEYVDFYRRTRVNYIRFHDSGNYEMLAHLVTPDSDKPWDSDLQRDFSADTARFRNVLKGLDWAQNVDPDEALLRYLKIYGYDHLRCCSNTILRQDITIAAAELLSQTRDEEPEVHLDPDDGTTRSRLPRIIRPEPKTLKIAFLHDKNPETSLWTQAHEQGRVYAQEKLGDRILTQSVFDLLQKDPSECIDALAEDGTNVIFTTTPRLLDVALKAAAKYPAVHFLNCSLNISHPLLRTYYGRMYEAKFLTGVIAGAMSGDDSIGYIANYPIYGMPASINAFALGAQMANPNARIRLEWSCIPGSDPRKTLREAGVTVISGQDMYNPADPRRDSGLFLIRPDGPKNIALATWHWGRFYRQIIDSIRDGRWSSLDSTEAEGRAISYWWGLSSGVIDIRYDEQLPRQIRRLTELLRRGIADGSFRPFEGPLYDRDGTLRIEAGQELTAQEIIKMDWLAENVDGSIPAADLLTPGGQALVRIQGVLDEGREDV